MAAEASARPSELLLEEETESPPSLSSTVSDDAELGFSSVSGLGSTSGGGAPAGAAASTGDVPKQPKTSTSSTGSSVLPSATEDFTWWTGLTKADVERALAMEKGSSEQGWTLVKETDGGKVWKKSVEGQPNQIVKV